MTTLWLYCLICALTLSLVLTWAVRKWALRNDLLDHPGHRSSHTIPTPRGGGLAIVITVAVGASLIGALVPGSSRELAIILLPAALIAVLGWADDRMGLSARLRLIVQFACAATVLGAATVEIGLPVTPVTLLWSLVLTVAIVWCTNLYNFMDGIDGLAGSEAVFVAAGGALLLGSAGGGGITAMLWVVAGACAGFLVWNWSPARIFMGDVGSAALGFLFAATAVYTSLSGYLEVWVWLLLLGTFVADATTTLAVRGLRREALTQAHRSHAYQRLARRLGSHPKATLLFLVVNVCWLLPWAVAVKIWPSFTVLFVSAGLGPLCWAAWRLGAGRADRDARG